MELFKVAKQLSEATISILNVHMKTEISIEQGRGREERTEEERGREGERSFDGH